MTPTHSPLAICSALAFSDLSVCIASSRVRVKGVIVVTTWIYDKQND